MIFYYWFFNPGFEFQDSVCNGSHDLTMLSVIISDITIINIKYNITLANLNKLIY